MQIGVSSSVIGASTVKVTIPFNGNLLGAGAAQATLVSYNPNLTAANFTAGSVPNGDLTMITYIPAGAIQFFPAKIPVSEGESVYVAFSAAGSAILYLETV